MPDDLESYRKRKLAEQTAAAATNEVEQRDNLRQALRSARRVLAP
jgi:hypothetical protein